MPMLATYFPLPAVLVLSAGTEVTALDSLPTWLGYLLPAVGLFVYSLFVGALNEVVRKRDAEGVPVSPRLRLVLAVLNAAAANLDKTRQQAVASKVPEAKP